MASISKPTPEEVEEAKKLETMEDFWDSHFGTTYELKDFSEETKTYFSELLSTLKKGVALDNGCGGGRIKKFIEEQGWEVYGADVSQEALNRAHEITPKNLFKAPGHNLPFDNSFFDLVISWRVLHNIPLKNRLKSLEEIGRVLKPGGVFVCSVQADSGSAFEEYTKVGVEYPNDPGMNIVNIAPREGERAVGLKKQYSKESLIKEIEEYSGLGIKKIEFVQEQSGMKLRKGKINDYWRVEAIKPPSV